MMVDLVVDFVANVGPLVVVFDVEEETKEGFVVEDGLEVVVGVVELPGKGFVATVALVVVVLVVFDVVVFVVD